MNISISNKVKTGLIVLAVLFMAYAPLKDVISWSMNLMEKPSVHLMDISFGTNFPWQKTQTDYVKVANTAQPLQGPQIIYTRFKLTNPTNESMSFKKIWLTFEQANRDREYTTDYNLYDLHTRQKLIGNAVQLAPNSEIELLASYRFIPSYPYNKPHSLQVSWEGKEQLRDSSCSLSFVKLEQNNFGQDCD